MTQPITKLRVIYLDMDGVLVDFTRGVLDAYLLPIDTPITTWNFFETLQIDQSVFWNEVASDPDWWANLKPCGNFAEVFALCQQYANRVMLCTSSGCPEAAWGKNRWARKHLHLDAKDIIHTTDKWRLAYMPGSLLVDDSDSNIQSWQEACVDAGRGFYDWAVRYPQPWNRSREFASRDEQIPYLQRNLRVHSVRYKNEEK